MRAHRGGLIGTAVMISALNACALAQQRRPRRARRRSGRGGVRAVFQSDDDARQQGGEGDGCVELAALAALLARLGVDGASTSALEQLFRLTDSHSRRRRAGASNEGPSNQGRRLSYASVREVLGTSVAGAASAASF